MWSNEAIFEILLWLTLSVDHIEYIVQTFTFRNGIVALSHLMLVWLPHLVMYLIQIIRIILLSKLLLAPDCTSEKLCIIVYCTVYRIIAWIQVLIVLETIWNDLFSCDELFFLELEVITTIGHLKLLSDIILKHTQLFS